MTNTATDHRVQAGKDAAVTGAVATPSAGSDVAEATALATDAIALVRRWLTEASKVPVDASAEQLAGVLKDPNGLDFTVGFVDGVVRPEDLHVAARNLAALAPKVPAFLPWYMRSAVQMGGLMAPVLPQVVIPVARKVLREMVGHLIVDATDSKLGPAIAKIRKDGIKLNVNLLGEAVLGEHEASRRLEGTHTLLARPTWTTSPSRCPPPWPRTPPGPSTRPWSTSSRSSPRCSPAPLPSAAGQKAKFINLDMEEYKDLDMTIAVFTRILDKPEFKNLEAGIVLQAYLPDALSAMIRLQEWAAAAALTAAPPSRSAWSRAPTFPWSRWNPPCTTGRWPPGAPSRTRTSTTSASSTTRCTRTGSATSASASPATTCSTSPSPGCWPSSAASSRASNSRCCSAWRRARPRRSRRTSAPCCSTRRWCTRPNSTSPSPT
jgi:hypothetical protein